MGRRRDAVAARRTRRCRRSGSRSPSAGAPRRPAASTPCGRTRPRAAPRSRSAPRGRSRARSPAPRRPPCPRRRAARRARRSAGCSQTRPCVSPVSAPSGFVAALKITLRHCGPRASATACGRHAGARARVGEPLDLGERRRLRLERAERRVALHVPLHDAGRGDLPGRERRAADHALDVPGEHLLVADPVLHRRDAAVGEGVRGRRDRRRRCASPWWRRSRSRTAAARPRRSVARRRPDDVAGAGQAQAVAVDRVDVLLREVVGPDLDVVERRRGSPRTATRPPRSRRRRPSPATSLLRLDQAGPSSRAAAPARRAAAPPGRAQPVIMSISVGRCASTSSSIDG